MSGSAPFYAYGVINDNLNSDGSFVFPVPASSLMETRGQTLPAVVEMGTFTSELMVTNFSKESKVLDFHFVADGVRTADQTARFRMRIEAGEQRIIPNLLHTELRQKGAAGVSSSRGGLAGALFARVLGGDMSGTVIGARTTSSNGAGGHYGVFYHAVPDGSAFTTSVWVDGLRQDRDNRSNLALVNTGEVDDSPSGFKLDIYDGTTGMLANTVTGLTIAARGWRQLNTILKKYAPGVSQGYVRVRRIFGRNPFLAYGVVNDGGVPGQRSGDGAFLQAVEAIHDAETAPLTDREVLEAFYHSTGGPGWKTRTHWLSDLPLSEWHGVTTDENGRVTSLHLSINGLSGWIPPELGRLTHLRALDLVGNDLSGTIPPELGRLSQLQELRLGGNQLSGTIPPELGGLTQLQKLSLGYNKLSGTIPLELGGLTQLQEMYLRDNELSGVIPFELVELTQLERLSVKGNQLIGAIPKDLQQLSELTLLDIRETGVCVPADAAFSAWLETMPRFFSSGLACDGTRRVLFSESNYEVQEGEAVTVSVRLIDQTGNPVRPMTISLTATPGGGATALDYSGVPERVSIRAPASEASFVVTAVKDTPFDPGETVMLGLRRPLPSGVTAGVPDRATVTIRDPGTEGMTDREVLEVLYHATGGANWSNRTHWLSDLPLSEWFGVTTDESSRVTRLHLPGNTLSGAIPPLLGQLSQLQVLDLGGNELSGVIPPELGGLTQLQKLNLEANQLSGTIPPSLGQLARLQELNLGANQLEGAIPLELGSLTHLQELNLWHNRLSEVIPLELGGLSQLRRLYLWYNRLSGTIPPELGGLTQLQGLDLAGNLLSGTIPPELGGLTQLQGLDLRDNRLSGTIPPELGELTNLDWVFLGHNRLSGRIPPELGEMNNLGILSLEGNELSGEFPPELTQLATLQELSLGFNQNLTGPIPAGLQQLPLSTLNLMATSVCVPEDKELQEWLATIEFVPSGLTCGRPPAAMSSIDVLVVYTPAARRYVGGTDEIEAVIDLMVAETNQAYLDSGVNQRLVLVARQEVAYAESGSSHEDLARLTSASDGHMDEVHALRDRTGADLVHFIVGVAQVFGTAWLAQPFALTWVDAGSIAFAHELGHNMGLSHDRYVDRGSFFPYSHGYVNQQAFADGAPKSSRWRTIMAYQDQCNDAGLYCGKIMRFSNPRQTYLGDPLGVPGEERTRAVNGPADAARTLNLTRHSVAGWRPRVSGNRMTMSSTLSQARSRSRAGGGTAAPVPGGSLFRAITPTPQGAASALAGGAADRAILRRREVSVDIDGLASGAGDGATTLRLNLFDDVDLIGIIEQRTPTFSGGTVLSGRLMGMAGGSVTLVVNGSVVAGTVRIPGATFRIRPAGSGRHAILQVDPSQFLQGCKTVNPTLDPPRPSRRPGQLQPGPLRRAHRPLGRDP